MEMTIISLCFPHSREFFHSFFCSPLSKLAIIDEKRAGKRKEKQTKKPLTTTVTLAYYKISTFEFFSYVFWEYKMYKFSVLSNTIQYPKQSGWPILTN